MAERVAGQEIERLIQLLARLPGLGPRSARRAALHLIRRRDELFGPLTEAMRVAHDRIVVCDRCGNIDTSDPCTICRDSARDGTVLTVVESVADLWALERSGVIRGRYHVLGGVLAPLDGIGPEDLNLATLPTRIRKEGVTEVILALNATVDGQTTAHYVTDLLQAMSARITRLAHGVPIGGELDYLDEGTLAAAIRARTAM